jgi:hypothetical protein
MKVLLAFAGLPIIRYGTETDKELGGRLTLLGYNRPLP